MKMELQTAVQNVFNMAISEEAIVRGRELSCEVTVLVLTSAQRTHTHNMYIRTLLSFLLLPHNRTLYSSFPRLYTLILNLLPLHHFCRVVCYVCQTHIAPA